MKRTGWMLTFVLVFSLFLRIWSIDRVPPELFGDELDVGYHAFSILNTGKDYYGQVFPTYIHSFSEWRAPLLMYATVPFVAVFGLNEWGVRLPEVIFGVISVFLLFLLVRKTLNNERVALFAALLLAVSPWHLQYSRAAFEVSLLTFLLLGGSLALVYGLKNNLWLILSALFFGLTFYTYNTANIFTPLIGVGLFAVYFKEIRLIPLKKLFLPVLVLIVVSAPIAYQIIFGYAAERFGKFSLLSDQEVAQQIEAKRLVGTDVLLERLFHNRPIEVTRRFISNYATSFSPQFLFIDGDVTFRHSIHEVGEFYWVELVLLLFGVLALVGKEGRSRWIWFIWLIVAPIPAGLTRDGAIHATRLILMLPPLIVISAVGLDYLLNIKWKSKIVARLVPVLIFLALFLETASYLHRYLVHYPVESWRWWHTGYKEAMIFMKNQDQNYQTIAFNNTYEPSLIRFLFWWQYPPDKFIEKFNIDKPQEDILPGFNGFKVGEKYYFGSIDQNKNSVTNFVKPGIMYLVSQRDEVAGDWDWEKNPPSGIKVLKTVRNPYKEPIFYIVVAN